jgi:drug/metabolite transporter (DMT)-like permease
LDAATQRRRVLAGYMAALVAAVGYGAGSVIIRTVVTDHIEPMVAAAYSLLLGTAVMVLIFPRQTARDLLVANRSAWTYMGLSGLASAWGLSFMFLALKEAPVVIVSPLIGVQPLVAILLTHLFLQRLERVTPRTVMGAALVVAGVVLVTIGRD